MIDDMVRGGGDQPPLDVDQLKLREITSDLAERESEGKSGSISVRRLAESFSAVVQTLNLASKGVSEGKGKKGHMA